MGYEDLFRLYVQYEYLDDYVRQYSDEPSEWLNRASENFLFSGLHIDIDNVGNLSANGFTNIDQINETYLRALQKSGTSERSIARIAPKNTALYLSYGFKDFAEFYENFEVIQQQDLEQFKLYQEGISSVEKFLKIDIKEHFVSWIGSEIGMLQIGSEHSVKGNLALVLKVKNVDEAKTNLDFVLRQIRKRTPVKFKTVEHREHEINFLSIKGFFKMLLGGSFQ